MQLSFNATIYKVGINPCVKVPVNISDRMKATKGFIPVKGKIEEHPFHQTLVSVKDEGYRLYVNGPMLKGANVKVGDTVHFTIEQDNDPKTREVPMVKQFEEALIKHKLLPQFQKLTPSRQKEVLKYLNYLKTEEALMRNINKVIDQLKKLMANRQ